MQPTDASARWLLRVTGPTADLAIDGVGVRLAQSSQVLLAYLAWAGPTPREQMARLLWPDSQPERARANLRQTLHRLRRLGGPVEGDPLRIAPHIDVLTTWAGSDADGEATGGGHALDPDRFGELASWFEAELERRAARALVEFDQGWVAAVGAGRWDDALALARGALAVDPNAEGPYARIMTAQIELGAPQDALAAYGRCRRMLARSYDAAPSTETRALAERAAVMVARSAGGALTPLGSLARRARAGGWTVEGVTVLQAAVASAPSEAEAGRRRVELAWLLHQLGDAPGAAREAEAALSDLIAVDDPTGTAECCFVLGSVARHRGDAEAARAWWTRALASSAGGTKTSERMLIHLNVAMVEDALDDAGAALPHYLEALGLARALDDRHVQATAMNNLAHAALAAGRPGEARTLLRAAHAAAAALADRLLLGCVLDGMAKAELACGDAAAARTLAARAHLIARDDRDAALQADTLVTLAEAAAADEPAAAQRLAREAFRAAAACGYVPGALEAAVVLAESLGSGDRRAAPLLAAIQADPRARRGTVARARGTLRAWGTPVEDPPSGLSATLAAVIGDGAVTLEEASSVTKEVDHGEDVALS